MILLLRIVTENSGLSMNSHACWKYSILQVKVNTSVV
jgi:hypothetical protein